MLSAEILQAAASIGIDKCYEHDDWNALQLSCSLNDTEVVKQLISDGATCDIRTHSSVIPRVAALHIACRYGYLEHVKALIPHCDANTQDQWGFTALHYATVARSKDVVLFLLANGASAITLSKNGCTALDIAQQLSFEDIIDALKSKSTLESDPTVPLFKNWLISLGAGEYTSGFIEAGYDLPFVAKHGLSDKDLDCVGIPNSKMGLRRKISELHQLEKFYTVEDDVDVDGSDEDDEDDDDDDDDDDD